jgi:hypothetical protein
MMSLPTNLRINLDSLTALTNDTSGQARRLFAKDVLAAKAQRKDKQRLKAILCAPASWHQGWWLHKQMLKATRSLSAMTSAQNVCLLHPQF